MLSLAIVIEEDGECCSMLLQIAHIGAGRKSDEALDALLEIFSEGRLNSPM